MVLSTLFTTLRQYRRHLFVFCLLFLAAFAVGALVQQLFVTLYPPYIPPTEKPIEIAPVYRDKDSQKDHASRGGAAPVHLGKFVVTAYDLSVDSCGKPIGHPAYGVTATGDKLSHKSWHEARTIAVDPDVIPLGSKVRLEFHDPKYKKYDGVYMAKDTGGAVTNQKVDLFHGDYQQNKAHKDTIAFGVRTADAWIIR